MSGILDFLGEVGENVVDHYAERGGMGGAILGGGLQKILNTDEYQYKKALREEYAADAPVRDMQRQEYLRNAEVRNLFMGKQKQEIQEYEANAPARKAAVEAETLKNQEFISNADVRKADKTAEVLRDKEFIDNAGNRKTLEDARAAQARLAKEAAEFTYRSSEINIIKDNVKKKLASSDPLFAQCNIKEQEDILDNPKMQALYDCTFYGRELLNARDKGDQAAFQRVVADIEKHGGKLTQDEKGNYTVGIYGRSIPLNEESFMKIQQQVEAQAMEEVKARQMLSPSFNKGNPMGQVFSQYATELSKYNGNKAKEAVESGQELFSGMDERTRGYMGLNKALDNYYDSTVSSADKMKGLEQGMFLAQRLGFTVDAPDGNPETARILDPANKRAYSLAEFRDYVKSQNSGQQLLDQQIETFKKAAEEKTRREVLRDQKNSFEEEQTPMSDMHKQTEEASQRAYKAVPKLQNIIQSKIKQYNMKNSKKPIDEKAVSRVVGTAQIEAEAGWNGDLEQFNKLLINSLNKDLSEYGISLNTDMDLGLNKKIHESKINENEEKIKKLNPQINEAQIKAGGQSKVNSMLLSQRGIYVDERQEDKNRFAGLLQDRIRISKDSEERKRKLALLTAEEERHKEANSKAAESKKKLNVLLGI